MPSKVDKGKGKEGAEGKVTAPSIRIDSIPLAEEEEEIINNNPPQDDTTSQGGYGGNAFSSRRQRGSDAGSRGTLGFGAVDSRSAENTPPQSAVDDEDDEWAQGTGTSASLNPYGRSSTVAVTAKGPGTKGLGGPGEAEDQDIGA